MREAFDVSALYYLEKPVDVTKLAKLFRTCIQDYQEQNYVIYFTMSDNISLKEYKDPFSETR